LSKWEHLLDVYDSIEEDASFDHLRRPGIRLVRGDGQHNAETARVMLVGEAPGAQENGAGRPFVGQSGMVLEGLLNRAGFWRENVFITNVVKYRPEGNRTPSLREQLDSTPYLRRTSCCGAERRYRARGVARWLTSDRSEEAGGTTSPPSSTRPSGSGTPRCGRGWSVSGTRSGKYAEK
jgi:hypothetical protein